MSFKGLLGLTGPKRNYHTNIANSIMLNGLETHRYDNLRKEHTILYKMVWLNIQGSYTLAILFQNFTYLHTKLSLKNKSLGASNQHFKFIK